MLEAFLLYKKQCMGNMVPMLLPGDSKSCKPILNNVNYSANPEQAVDCIGHKNTVPCSTVTETYDLYYNVFLNIQLCAFYIKYSAPELGKQLSRIGTAVINFFRSRICCFLSATVHELWYKKAMLEFCGNGFHIHDIQANKAWTGYLQVFQKCLYGKTHWKGLNGSYFCYAVGFTFTCY